jgi:hypothetical protein
MSTPRPTGPDDETAFGFTAVEAGVAFGFSLVARGAAKAGRVLVTQPAAAIKRGNFIVSQEFWNEKVRLIQAHFSMAQRK